MARKLEVSLPSWPRPSKALIEAEVRRKLQENPRDLLEILQGESQGESQGETQREAQGESQGESQGEESEREGTSEAEIEAASGARVGCEIKRFNECSLEDIRRIVWIENLEIKDWIPLDEPLRLHFLRTSLFFFQISSCFEPVPKMPRGDDLLQLGYRKKNDKEPVTSSNIAINWGCGGKQ